MHSIAKYPAPRQFPNYPRTGDELAPAAHQPLMHVPSNAHALSKEERMARAERVDTSELFRYHCHT